MSRERLMIFVVNTAQRIGAPEIALYDDYAATRMIQLNTTSSSHYTDDMESSHAVWIFPPNLSKPSMEKQHRLSQLPINCTLVNMEVSSRADTFHFESSILRFRLFAL